MPRRLPAAPPRIPGFEYVSHIGSGGYADVFLYEQAVPNRRVAVKVLDPTTLPSGGGQASFVAEANLMAKVSAHPYIVQIFQTGVADDERPYLVMEYYPGPNYQERVRDEQFSVADALRTGINLASAVETAHRAGILHRDIKPANVLTSEYRRPALTDFGIAAAHGPDTDTADGVSIPWSPPEALAEAPGDRRSDVYSLAATVYHLIAGRSPFEIPGGDNRQLALISRIERHPVPALGRADVPASLERVLSNALAKNPAHRPDTAAEFGRQLQAVESELRLAVTPLELAEDRAAVRMRSDDTVDDDSTRVKGVVEIRAQERPAHVAIAEVPASPSGGASVAPRRREGLLAEPEVGDTVVRRGEPTPELAPLGAPSGLDIKWVIAGVGAVVLVLIVGLALVMGGSEDDDRPAVVEAEVNDNLGQPLAVPPPAVAEVTAVPLGDGTFRFSWADQGADVTYAVRPDGGRAVQRIDDAEFESDASCVEVEVIAPNGLVSAPTRGCAP